MILEALMLKQKLIGGTIMVAALALLVWGTYGLGFSNGFISGVKSKAKEIGKLTQQITSMTEAQNELHAKNKSLKAKAIEAKDDAAAAWEHARTVKSRTYRVLHCPQAGSDGKTPEDRDTRKPADVAGQSGVGTSGVATEELSIDEINRRLNAAEKAAGQLAHLIAAVRRQQRIYE